MRNFTKITLCIFSLGLLVKVIFPNRSDQVEDAVKEGRILLREVREEVQLPAQFDTSGFREGARYVRAPDDEKSFYISIPVKFSRDSVIYSEGPLYPKNGWYFQNQKINEYTGIP